MKYSCLVLPNDPLSIYVKQGNLEQFIDRFKYYADNLGPVYIFNLDYESIIFSYPGIEIITIKKPKFKLFEFSKKLYWMFKLCRIKKPSFLRTPEGGTFTKSAIIGIVGKITGTSSMSSLHGHYNGFKTLRGHNILQKPIFKILEYITAWTNTLVVSNSGYTQKQFVFKNTPIVPNYVNCKIFTPQKQEKKWDLFYVGSLLPIKGIGVLVSAFGLIKKKYPNAKLLVAGHGPLQKLLNVNGITYNGSIKNTDLPKYYNNSQIFITASLQESFGIPLIEAQACGIPVVATNLGPFYENSVPGETSILVDVNNAKALAAAVITLLTDENKLKEMGEKSRSFVLKEFSREIVLEKELSLIKQMLKSKTKIKINNEKKV